MPLFFYNISHLKVVFLTIEIVFLILFVYVIIILICGSSVILKFIKLKAKAIANAILHSIDM
ncbi:MAG: hypothetical protein K0R31_481 [Clostridiales bacterium]|jgi:Trk-type K+ transport system membrane component|nr:hypothetical protein [Clostridiales bacterium]